MGEFIKIASEILSAVLPDSDVGKLVALLLVLMFLLILFGRFRLEWIGVSILHIFRWLRCKVRNKHRYVQEGIGWIDFNTGYRRGTFVCAVCGKVWVQK